MKYFKLELLNREENFNQKFGGGMNVGVMQVLKTKTGPNVGSLPQQQGGGKRKPQRGGKSQRRVPSMTAPPEGEARWGEIGDGGGVGAGVGLWTRPSDE